MEPPPVLAQYIPPRKRLLSAGSSSASFVDSEVTEIPSSAFQTLKRNKQKQAIIHEVIDVEDYVDSADVMVHEKVDTREKGKAIKHNIDGSSSYQPKESTKSSGPGLHNLIILDSYDDHFLDLHDNINYLDDYAILQAYFDSANIPTGVEAPVPWFTDPASSSKKTVPWFTDPASSIKKKAIPWVTDPASSSNKKDNRRKPSSSRLLNPVGVLGQTAVGDLPSSLLPPIPAQIEPSMPLWPYAFEPELNPTFTKYNTHSSFFDLFDAVHIPPEEGECIPPAQDCALNPSGDEDDILNKYKLFKQFDTVEDYSDHHYASNSKASTMKQPPKNWAKRIQEEWKILEKDLPDTIFVRVYESRMDLLRAVIIGAEGTPYHDGLFFFDVFFPSGYPNVPPLVYYHSGGLRINPNLYNCGKVCLSLLNTWSGNKNEKWIPSMSTMLQVLVSIQALILNQKPYFNEPGYASSNGTAHGENSSQRYNENTFILSLKTMVYTVRRPPKYFKEFVVGHFYKCARDIVTACKAYMDGAQVGCLVKGGVQDVDEGDKSSSEGFKNSLRGYVDMLVKEFKQIGVKNCENILALPKRGPRGVKDGEDILGQPKRGTRGVQYMP
ncbi:hypothetical protein LWI28_027905 [Acer negundo]|uniref:E2 ubiquitin-conjugating enzyme n=1 Tax=Acer negundo TaxID=4023 RepID=A0AAD5J8P0_ACENE|nr:hypothetical protein LWI28_027905 [Acer negundo]KAK4852141.1 hypothetical protein QYF36_021398 [Acer negundo]